MNSPNPALFAVYRRSLAFYPSHLRAHYRNQMLQTLCDAHAEAHRPALFWLRTYADLLESIVQENLYMLRDQLSSRPIFFHAVILGIILTGMGGAASLVFQQMLRRGANYPQFEMAHNYASAIASGVTPDQAIPSAHVNLQRSLEPFLIFYSDQGAPVSSNGFLNDAIPVPPQGVLEYARKYQEDAITWQPQPGVRIAAIIRRVDGAHPGFLLAGRSLRVVEEYESLFWKIVFGAWITLVLLLTAGAALLTRAQRRPALAS